MENQDKKAKHTASYLFIGFMFIGMAAGMFFDKPEVGMFGGMGLGFLAYAVYNSEKNK